LQDSIYILVSSNYRCKESQCEMASVVKGLRFRVLFNLPRPPAFLIFSGGGRPPGFGLN